MLNSIAINYQGMKKEKTLSSEQTRAAENLSKIWHRKRKELQLTQEKVAEKMEITQGAVYQFINGKAPLNLENVLKFSAILNCEPEEIYPEIIPYILKQYIKEGFINRDQRDREVLKVAEEILSLPQSQQVAIRAYFQTLTHEDEDQANQ